MAEGVERGGSPALVDQEVPVASARNGVALWPARRLRDPPVQGMLAHIDARGSASCSRGSTLSTAEAELLALRLESLQAEQGAQDAGETAGDDSAE